MIAGAGIAPYSFQTICTLMAMVLCDYFPIIYNEKLGGTQISNYLIIDFKAQRIKVYYA
jgi:hypothetical protein